MLNKVSNEYFQHGYFQNIQDPVRNISGLFYRLFHSKFHSHDS